MHFKSFFEPLSLLCGFCCLFLCPFDFFFQRADYSVAELHDQVVNAVICWRAGSLFLHLVDEGHKPPLVEQVVKLVPLPGALRSHHILPHVVFILLPLDFKITLETCYLCLVPLLLQIEGFLPTLFQLGSLLVFDLLNFIGFGL